MRRSAAKVIELFQTTIDCQHHDDHHSEELRIFIIIIIIIMVVVMVLRIGFEK